MTILPGRRSENPPVRIDRLLLGLLVATPALLLLTTESRAAEAAAAGRPNVLMIIIDDVAANLHSVNGNKGPVRTPNIERLAAQGTWFSHAYNDAPVCCGSRTALLTGVHAARSGVYYNTQPFRRSGTWIAGVDVLPTTFLKQGYLVGSFGKLFHSGFQTDEIGDFTPGYFHMHSDPKDVTNTDGKLLKQIIPGSRRDIPGTSSRNWAWGVLPDDWDRDDPAKWQQDTQQADRTIQFLQADHDKPFFLACGLWRPHVPWTVPQRYFDRFPLDAIELPAGYKPDDLDDLPKPGRWIASHRREHAEIVAGAMWKKCLQGYMASMAYIDEQIGRVCDALDHSKFRDNTIVVFFSDNGMHLGEKDHWLKYALWEQTCQVFLSVSGPGLSKQTCDSPVSLIDLYPTLLDLCRLAPPSHPLDGLDLTEVLRGTRAGRGQPVLSTYGRANHAVRDDRYRYIRYRNGAEELYDHSTDPYEWDNLADHAEFKPVKERLAKWLPEEDAADVPEVNPEGDGSRWKDEAFR